MAERSGSGSLGTSELSARQWLSEEALGRFGSRLRAARKRAAKVGSVLVSVSERLPQGVDPSAVVLASRRPGDAWSCLEQPDREGASLATLGCAIEMQQEGETRFAALDRRWRELTESALTEQPIGPAGAGLIAVAGFAFSDAGARSPQWRGFPSGSLVVPEVSLARGGEETWLTLNATVAPGDDTDELLARTEERLRSLIESPPPLLDPAPVGRFTVHSPMPPSHFEEAVRRAVEKIRDGALEKVVLAREVHVEAPAPHDPAAIFGVLRSGFPECFVYAVGRGEAAFVGATPELLVRREGQRASTVALAGSMRRSADPAVDDHLGEALLHSVKDREENLIVARRIAQALAPHSLWVTVAHEPALVRVANIQHLAAPIRAQLKAPMSALQLAGLLHPTPAVGGEPDDRAQALIPALEGFDRGWYAGTIGWTDLSGDGELCVALRCALLRRREAACFAGCGIVAESEPAAELAETEVKLQALLPLLAG